MALSKTDIEDPALILAITFVFAGFGFKIAAVPFHMWQPDVYQGAPTPITAFLSVGPKIAGFAVLLRVFLYSFAEQQVLWSQLITVIAIVTMAIGSLVALVQTNIKRLLAYSSIGHVGFILLGFLTSPAEGFNAILFYLFVYAFMNLGAFAVIIALYSRNSANEEIDDYTGLAPQPPPLASISNGIIHVRFSGGDPPPTAGFFAKFNIIMVLLSQQHIVLAVLAVIFSVISATTIYG